MADFLAFIVATRCLFVQGCARSGNTLMRDLSFAAFRDAELLKLDENRAEMLLEQAVAHLDDETLRGKLLVASRNRTASLFMDAALLHSRPEIGVLWMIRNPLDVLTSVHKEKAGFYVEPYRLVASLNLYQQFARDPQVLMVRYEDLVSDPASVQKAISEKFGVGVSRDFVDCHEHFPRFKQNMKAVHSIRPIDSKSVEKWRSNPEFARYLSKALRSHPEIIPLAKLCGGYEIDVKEVNAATQGSTKGGPLKKFRTIFGTQPAEVGADRE